MGDTSYLIKHHDTWHVVVEIPRHLREQAGGKRRLKHSLKTSDLATANKHKHTWVAEFKRRIDTLAKQEPDRLAPMISKALELRDALAQARADGIVMAEPSAEDLRANPHLEPIEVDVVEEVLDLIREQARDIQQHQDAPTASRFYAVATGHATFIRDLSALWVDERAGQIKRASGRSRRASSSTIWVGLASTRP